MWYSRGVLPSLFELRTMSELDIVEQIFNGTQQYHHESTTLVPQTLKITASFYILMVSHLLVWIFGSIGNILSLILFSRKEFRVSLTGFLFQSLAFFDLIVVQDLIQSICWWIGLPNFLTITSWSCKLRLWIVVSARLIGVWILISVGIERVVCVIKPHQAKILLSRKRGKIFLLVLICCVLTLQIPQILTSESVGFYDQFLGKIQRYCIPNGSGAVGYYMYNVESWVFLCIYSLIPFTILIIINTIIIVSLHKAHKRRQLLMVGGSSGQGKGKTKDGTSTNAPSDEAGGPQLTSLTTMLLSISFSFIVLTCPWCIHILLRNIASINIKILGHSSFVLLVINHSINFVLYCLSGKRFRQEFINLICCRKN